MRGIIRWPVDKGQPSRRACNSESVSTAWRHHAMWTLRRFSSRSDDKTCGILVRTSRHVWFDSPVYSRDPHLTITAHYDDVIMTMLASQITSLTVVYSIVYSGVNQRKHQSSASLAFVREIHRGPVNFPHKWPVTRKMFPFDDVIMACRCSSPEKGAGSSESTV